MIILKENIDKLFIKYQYKSRMQYDNTELNRLFNYWCFFEEKEAVIQETLEIILYSKYYWCSRYKDKYIELYGIDVGLEQQQYKIMEELEQRLDADIDWKFLELLEEDNV